MDWEPRLTKHSLFGRIQKKLREFAKRSFLRPVPIFDMLDTHNSKFGIPGKVLAIYASVYRYVLNRLGNFVPARTPPQSWQWPSLGPNHVSSLEL